jgi:hypothetical protein
MDDFACGKCGQKFKLEHHLKQHLDRKRPCIIEVDDVNNPLRCIHCKQVYSTKPNLLKHSRKCKMKNGGVVNIPDPNIRLAEQMRILMEEREKEKEEREKEKEEQKKKDEEQKKKDEERDKKDEELRAMIKEILLRQTATDNSVGNTGTNHINTNNNIGVQNNNVNIVINNYNTPNIDHLLKSDPFFKTLGKFDIDLPIELILYTYFDPSHPENSSIHMTDKETKRILAMVDGTWNVFTMESMVEKLRELGYKFAAEGFRIHSNPEYPERCKYIETKKDVINQIARQKNSPKNIEYESGRIQQKLFDEYNTSSKHPAVIAESSKKKKEIADAKNATAL